MNEEQLRSEYRNTKRETKPHAESSVMKSLLAVPVNEEQRLSYQLSEEIRAELQDDVLTTIVT